MPLTQDSTLTIGLAITLMGAAGSFGIMWNKIANLQRQQALDREDSIEWRERMEAKIDRLLELCILQK